MIAFEPNPAAARKLQKNIEINGLKNITVVAIALGSKSRRSSFYLAEPAMATWSSLKKNPLFKTERKISLKTDKLDSQLEKLGVGRVDAIKIDTEGAEKSIFMGAKKLISSAQHPVILFECADFSCRAFGHCVFDVLSILNKARYDLREISLGQWIAVPKSHESKR